MYTPTKNPKLEPEHPVPGAWPGRSLEAPESAWLKQKALELHFLGGLGVLGGLRGSGFRGF